jgi:hypothetical protein
VFQRSPRAQRAMPCKPRRASASPQKAAAVASATESCCSGLRLFHKGLEPAGVLSVVVAGLVMCRLPRAL